MTNELLIEKFSLYKQSTKELQHYYQKNVKKKYRYYKFILNFCCDVEKEMCYNTKRIILKHNFSALKKNKKIAKKKYIAGEV